MIFFLSQTWIVQELEPTTEMDHFHNSTTGDGDDDDGYAFVMERMFFGEIVKGLKNAVIYKELKQQYLLNKRKQ